MDVDTTGETAIPTEAEARVAVPQAHGGVLHPWPKGVSGNPSGRPRSRAVALFNEVLEDDAEAEALIHEYLRLCLHARSEDLRAKMLCDLLDRVCLPRATGERSSTAVAQVVNIVRNSPELGV